MRHRFDSPFVTAGFAALDDVVSFNSKGGLGVFAFRAEYELLDVNIENVLQLRFVMRSVDDESIVFLVDLSLSTQFHSEEFSWKDRLSIERTGDVDHVDDDRFDTISLAFDFGDYAGHLVPVERVINLSVNIILLLGHFDASGLKFVVFFFRLL